MTYDANHCSGTLALLPAPGLRLSRQPLQLQIHAHLELELKPQAREPPIHNRRGPAKR
jgi:hypothetical protein